MSFQFTHKTHGWRIPLTKKQRAAVKRLWERFREDMGGITYKEFRKMGYIGRKNDPYYGIFIELDNGWKCFFGIEPDGHTHT